MDFIYISSFTLSENFHDQFVTDMSELVLKGWAAYENGSMMIVIFLHKVEDRLS